MGCTRSTRFGRIGAANRTRQFDWLLRSTLLASKSWLVDDIDREEGHGRISRSLTIVSRLEVSANAQDRGSQYLGRAAVDADAQLDRSVDSAVRNHIAELSGGVGDLPRPVGPKVLASLLLLTGLY